MQTSDEAVFQALRFLDCDPEIVGEVAKESLWTIEPFHGRCRIYEEGIEIGETYVGNPLTDFLHHRLFLRSLAARPNAAALHAASLRRHGRRILIAGTQGAGKTTLALLLIRAGYDFEGDEHVFLVHDCVIARPRACRLKETSLPLLSPFVNNIASAPAYVDDQGLKVFNLDPRMIGGSWRIEQGDADAVIVLRPNHGGYSSIRCMQPMALAQALVSEMGLRESGRGASIGAVAKLVSKAKAFDLSIGDPETALACIHRAVEEC